MDNTICFETQDKYFTNFGEFIQWVSIIALKGNTHIVSATFRGPEIWIKYRDATSKPMEHSPAFGQTGSVEY